MSNEDVLSIEDTNNNSLQYRFTPAALISNFVPLIVILGDASLHFEYKMWNVLTIVDSVTEASEGVLQKLIKDLAEEYECEEHIYLFGVEEGAYNTLLHGVLSQANAVYTLMPRVNDGSFTSKERTLCRRLNSVDSFPIFYLSYRDDEVTKDDESSEFLTTCKTHKIACELKRHSNIYDVEMMFKKALDMLERMV